MKYFHIIGTMCSGKSELIHEINKINESSASWDVFDNFYIPLGILGNSEFDFYLFNEHKHSIRTILEIFLFEYQMLGYKNIFFESSGTSIFFNQALKKLNIEIIPIVLETPLEEILIKRAKQSGKSTKTVLDFTKMYSKKSTKIIDYINNNDWCKSLGVKAPLDWEEAYNTIVKLIEDNE